jgi:hypothetical protein
VKASGYGRTHGRLGLHEASQAKFVEVDRGRLLPPWWFPYRPTGVAGFRGALETFYSRGAAARARAAWRHRRGLLGFGRRLLTRP